MILDFKDFLNCLLLLLGIIFISFQLFDFNSELGILFQIWSLFEKTFGDYYLSK